MNFTHILSTVAEPSLIQKIIDSLKNDGGMYATGVLETLYMTVVSTVFAYIFGLILASILFVTSPRGTNPKPALYNILSWIVNMGRSIPYLILMVILIPVTRAIVGVSIGTTAAIVPLIIGSTPMVARVLQSSFEEVDSGIIESAVAMGASSFEIIFKVVIPEALPSIIRGMSLSSITILGFTAMAGATGGGGLGKLAMTYGYTRYQTEVLVITLVLLIVIVQIIQSIFNWLANLMDKRNR